MRSPIVSRHVRRLYQAGMVLTLALSASACSSDFTRFDRDLRAALPQSANQQQAANQYPGDIDPTTTASIGGVSAGQALDRSGRPIVAPYPAGDVVTPVVQPDHAAGAYNGSLPEPAGYNTPRSLAPSTTPGAIESRALPAPNANPLRNGTAKAAQRIDNTVTKSVVRPQAPAPVSVQREVVASASDGAGWSRAGGTAITVRSGETLYNLSKRYGVPVREIMRANGISNAHSVQSGQQIVIPTYVYSQSAPVSAPDANPQTAAARSTTGLIGEAQGPVVLPSQRPQQMAAVRADGTTAAVDTDDKPRYQPVPRTMEQNDQNVPDYSVVTGSVQRAVAMDGVYTVQSGDTLSAIASRNGTSVDALMAANGIASTNLKIGQQLQIPSGNSAGQPAPVAAAPVQAAPAPIKAAEQAKAAQPKGYTRPTVDQTVTSAVDVKAPERTGISNLRWPVNGRVISNFGDSRRDGPNDGIDISVPEGTPVRAAENGVVVYSGEIEGFGNLILLRHGDGLVTAYAHNKQNKVSKGSSVKRGDVIALSGRTGSATAPMLHFEVRKDTKPVNPEKYLGG